MGTVSKILSGTGILIAIFLFLNNGKQTANIINQLGTTYTGAVKTLQGR